MRARAPRGELLTALAISVVVTIMVMSLLAQDTAPVGKIPPAAAAASSAEVDNSIMDGRLTLTTGVPVTTSDVTGASTVYWTPYKGNRMTLYTGTAWTNVSFSEMSIALSALTSDLNYDVFVDYNDGTEQLALTAWTNDTTRATALALQDGVYVKTGDTQQRYVGTIRTTSTTTTEDSGGGVTTSVGGKRFVWNYYNRVPRSLSVIDTTNTWSYATATIRQARATAGNKVEFIIGVSEDPVVAMLLVSVQLLTGGTGYAGVGLDTTTAFSGLAMNAWGSNNANIHTGGRYEAAVAAGYHYLSWNEKGSGAGTVTWNGDNGEDGTQSGISGRIDG